MKSFNSLKYLAYCGYSNYEVLFGQITDEANYLTYKSVEKEFISVGLMKYFLLNINITLFLAFFAILIFAIYFLRKAFIRNKYLKSFDQLEKDKFVKLKRSTRWIYDHGVFPIINGLSMIGFFCIIIYLEAADSESQSREESISSTIELIEETSYMANLIVILLAFLIICSEVFISYEDYKESMLTFEERERIPKSLIEKLGHDENDPNRSNYKPGYVLIYMIYYFILELILIFDIFLKEFRDIGVEILIAINLVYLIIVWIWNPYYEVINFHNKALKFNHSTTLFFIIIISILNRCELSTIYNAVLVFISVFLFVIVGILGYVRIYVEHQFRKKLEKNPNILKIETPETEVVNLKNKKISYLNNQFLFENQIKEICLKNNLRNDNLELETPDKVEFIKREVLNEMLEDRYKVNDSCHPINLESKPRFYQKNKNKVEKEEVNYVDEKELHEISS